MPPSTAVAEPNQEQSTEIVPWRDALRNQGGALHAFLPNEEVRNRFMRVVAQAVERNPDLAECTPESIASAAVEAAMYGLEPSGAAGGAHLVPFNTKVKRGGTERWEKRAQLIVDYRGQLQLARDSERVEDAYAVIVRKADHFRYDAANGLIEHVPDLAAAQSPNPEDPANPMTHVYAVLVFTSGYRRVEVMSKAQVDAVRAMSKAANGPAWTGSYLEMAKKTAMHRGLKTAPLKPGARAILDRDPDFDFEQPRVTVTRPAQGRLADRLREKRLTLTSGESNGGPPSAGAMPEGVSHPPSGGSPTCAHPQAKHQATDAGVVCGDCGTLLASRDGADASPTRARRTRKAAEPKKAGDEGYGTARAHAMVAELGLDHDALRRIAADILKIEPTDIDRFSLGELTEADWEPIIVGLQEAPKNADDEAAEAWASSCAITAGLTEDADNPWSAVTPYTLEWFGKGTDDETLTNAELIEFGLRIVARTSAAS